MTHAANAAAAPRVTAAASAPADWEELLRSAGADDYSLTSHWLTCAAAHRPGARTVWLLAHDGDRLLGGLSALESGRARLGGLVRTWRAESSVDGTAGGPVVRGDLPPDVRARVAAVLLDAFAARRRGGIATAAVALGGCDEAEFGPLLAARPGWRRRDIPTAVIPLAGGPDEVAARRFNNTKRNERNRGLKRGAEVFATTEPAPLEAYYPLYAAAAAHWGIPATPLGQLRDLLTDPDGRVFFTCVRLEGKVIGGHLCLHLGGRVFAWNGVSDPARARTHFPATLLFWGDVLEACRRGADLLDLGASGGAHSLETFKRYFGAETERRGYYVAESAGAGLLRRLRGRAAAGGRRWHDGRTGRPAGRDRT